MDFQLRTMLIVAAMAAAPSAFAQSAPAVPAASPASAALPTPCAAPSYRAFDFWVGEWDVWPAESGPQVATSSIEAMFDGCAIRETWKPFKGAGGGSFSSYDRDLKIWRQAWVDGYGGRVDFDGGAVDGKMVLTGTWRNSGGPGKHAITRMTYTANGDGSVRQFGEQSADHGVSWTASFDFIYRPRKGAAGDKK